MLKRRFIGDRAFYAMVLAVGVPIVVQNGITSFVSLLDNVMVGRLGTEQLSGVAIANQLIFVYELSIFGALAGAGIFSAQFFGFGDMEGLRNTFRVKLFLGLLVSAAGALIFWFWGDLLIDLFLRGGGDVGDAAETAACARTYMRVMLIGFLPFTLTQVYASTLKETAETVLPMKASVAAVLINLALNWLLIFGKLGLPALGALGAAIATVVSRFAEAGIVIYGTHRHSGRFDFVRGLYRTLRVPSRLLGSILRKGLPLLANELLWSSSMAVLTQCYSLRGLVVVAGVNISSTVVNLCSVVMMALGNTVAILVGQQLGAGELEKARDTDNKLIAFAVAVSALIGLLLAALSPFIPRIYNTEPEVRSLATSLLLVSGLTLPISAFVVTAYFTMRSGGKTVITFLFDSAYSWVLTIPAAYLLVHFTAMPIVPLYLTVQLTGLVKCAIGYGLLKKGVWMQNIIQGSGEASPS